MRTGLFSLGLVAASALAFTAQAHDQVGADVVSIGVGASIDVEEVSSKELRFRRDLRPAHTDAPRPDDFVRRLFAAKFVCGSVTPHADDLEKPDERNVHHLTPGTYATAINIFNPYDDRVKIRKTVVLAFPEREVQPRTDGGGPGAGEPKEEHLDGFWAFEVDCKDIRWLLGDHEDRHRFLKGFVVIETEGDQGLAPDLQVTAVYTYKNVDAVVRHDDRPK